MVNRAGVAILEGETRIPLPHSCVQDGYPSDSFRKTGLLNAQAPLVHRSGRCLRREPGLRFVVFLKPGVGPRSTWTGSMSTCVKVGPWRWLPGKCPCRWAPARRDPSSWARSGLTTSATEVRLLFRLCCEWTAIHPPHQLHFHIGKEHEHSGTKKPYRRNDQGLTRVHGTTVLSRSWNLGPRSCSCHSIAKADASRGFSGGSWARTGT